MENMLKHQVETAFMSIYYHEGYSESHPYDKKTWEMLNGFYDQCLKYWEKEKEINFEWLGFSLNKSPVELALQDVESVKRDPSVPKGQLLDTLTKERWLHEKHMKLTNKEVEKNHRAIQKSQRNKNSELDR